MAKTAQNVVFDFRDYFEIPNCPLYSFYNQQDIDKHLSGSSIFLIKSLQADDQFPPINIYAFNRNDFPLQSFDCKSSNSANLIILLKSLELASESYKSKVHSILLYLFTIEKFFEFLASFNDPYLYSLSLYFLYLQHVNIDENSRGFLYSIDPPRFQASKIYNNKQFQIYMPKIKEKFLNIYHKDIPSFQPDEKRRYLIIFTYFPEFSLCGKNANCDYNLLSEVPFYSSLFNQINSDQKEKLGKYLSSRITKDYYNIQYQLPFIWKLFQPIQTEISPSEAISIHMSQSNQNPNDIINVNSIYSFGSSNQIEKIDYLHKTFSYNGYLLQESELFDNIKADPQHLNVYKALKKAKEIVNDDSKDKLMEQYFIDSFSSIQTIDKYLDDSQFFFFCVVYLLKHDVEVDNSSECYNLFEKAEQITRNFFSSTTLFLFENAKAVTDDDPIISTLLLLIKSKINDQFSLIFQNSQNAQFSGSSDCFELIRKTLVDEGLKINPNHFKNISFLNAQIVNSLQIAMNFEMIQTVEMFKKEQPDVLNQEELDELRLLIQRRGSQFHFLIFILNAFAQNIANQQVDLTTIYPNIDKIRGLKNSCLLKSIFLIFKFLNVYSVESLTKYCLHSELDENSLEYLSKKFFNQYNDFFEPFKKAND